MSETTVTEPTASGRGRRRSLSTASGVALAVVTVAGLAFGSGLGRSAPATLAARAASLESKIKCPSCEDISVAQSDASAAVEARHQIKQMLANGDSDAAIEQSFVQRYGPAILLEPPASGLSALVWVLPIIGGALALVALGALFWRRQRALRMLRAR